MVAPTPLQDIKRLQEQVLTLLEHTTWSHDEAEWAQRELADVKARMLILSESVKNFGGESKLILALCKKFNAEVKAREESEALLAREQRRVAKAHGESAVLCVSRVVDNFFAY